MKREWQNPLKMLMQETNMKRAENLLIKSLVIKHQNKGRLKVTLENKE